MRNLEKFTTREVAKAIRKDTFFKQRCVHKLFFLIDDYGFNQIEIEDSGKGSIVIFKKKALENLSVTVEYEMGTLPTIAVSLNKETIKDFSEYENLQAYPVHYEIQQIVQGEISSIDNYIKELGAVWESKNDEISKEMNRSLDSLANKTKQFIKSDLHSKIIMTSKDFNVIAKEQFEFLESDFGFQLSKSKKEDWGYESIYLNKTTGVKITYEFREAYIFIMLYKLVDGNLVENPRTIQTNTELHGYGLDDIISLRNPLALIKPAHQYGTVSEYYDKKEGLTLYVSAFSKNLKEYASDILAGDFKIFGEAKKVVKQRVNKYKSKRNI